MMRLGGHTLVIDDPRSLEGAIQKARQQVDALLGGRLKLYSYVDGSEGQTEPPGPPVEPWARQIRRASAPDLRRSLEGEAVRLMATFRGFPMERPRVAASNWRRLCARAFKAARFRAPEGRGLCSCAPLTRCPSGPAFEAAASPPVPMPDEAARGARLSKTRNITMSTKTNRPTHRAYAVTKSGDRTFWREIGAALAARRRRGLQPAAPDAALEWGRHCHPQAKGGRGRRGAQ